MVNEGKSDTARGSCVLWAQVALALAGLVLSLVLPSAGKAGVLIPITTRDPGIAGRWAISHDTTILQRGTPKNSVVIIVPSLASVWDALREGMVLLPAAAVGCAAPTNNQGS